MPPAFLEPNVIQMKHYPMIFNQERNKNYWAPLQKEEWTTSNKTYSYE